MWARPSWPRPWDSRLFGPVIPSASSMLTTSSGAMTQARVDNSLDRTIRSFLSPDLLILDDLGLHKLTGQQSGDLYELIIGRHRVSSFVITSNRGVEEWLGLFDDPTLENSALDRMANASFQIVIEGASCREKLSPHRALLEKVGKIVGKGGD